jgi:hypothetical protein
MLEIPASMARVVDLFLNPEACRPRAIEPSIRDTDPCSLRLGAEQPYAHHPQPQYAASESGVFLSDHSETTLNQLRLALLD